MLRLRPVGGADATYCHLAAFVPPMPVSSHSGHSKMGGVISHALHGWHRGAVPPSVNLYALSLACPLAS